MLVKFLGHSFCIFDSRELGLVGPGNLYLDSRFLLKLPPLPQVTLAWGGDHALNNPILCYSTEEQFFSKETWVSSTSAPLPVLWCGVKSLHLPVLLLLPSSAWRRWESCCTRDLKFLCLIISPFCLLDAPLLSAHSSLYPGYGTCQDKMVRAGCYSTELSTLQSTEQPSYLLSLIFTRMVPVLFSLTLQSQLLPPHFNMWAYFQLTEKTEATRKKFLNSLSP